MCGWPALTHERVRNRAGEIVGAIEDIVVDSQGDLVTLHAESIAEVTFRALEMFRINWLAALRPGRGE